MKADESFKSDSVCLTMTMTLILILMSIAGVIHGDSTFESSQTLENAPPLTPEHLLFLKQKTFSLSQSSWWVSLVISLEPYKQMLERLTNLGVELDYLSDYMITTIHEPLKRMEPMREYFNETGVQDRPMKILMKESRQLINYILYFSDYAMSELAKLKKRLVDFEHLSAIDNSKWSKEIEDLKDLLHIDDPEILRNSEKLHEMTSNEGMLSTIQSRMKDRADLLKQGVSFDGYFSNIRMLRGKYFHIHSSGRTSVNSTRSPMFGVSRAKRASKVNKYKMRKQLVKLKEQEKMNKFRFKEIREFEAKMKTRGQRRSKRFVMSLISQAISAFSGIKNQADMSQIKHDISQLKKMDATLKQAFQDEIVVINSTMLMLKRNQESLYTSFLYLETMLNASIHETRTFAEMFQKGREVLYYTLAFQQYLDQIKENFNDLEKKYETLLDFRLSPQILPPHLLLDLVENITKELPPYMYMPLDQHHDLLSLYKSIKAIPLKFTRGILVILDFSILDYRMNFDLYNVVNMETFLPNSTWTAKYELESEIFAVSRDLQWVIFPTQDEFYTCVHANHQFCKIQQGLFAVQEFRQNCLINLFSKNTFSIDSCPVKFQRSDKKVSVAYVKPGLWLVSLAEQIVIKKLCHVNSGNEPITHEFLTPGVHYLEMEPGCECVSSLFRIPEYTRGSTMLGEIHAPPMISGTHDTIWSRLQDVLKAVKEMPDLNLQHLLEGTKTITGIHDKFQRENQEINTNPRLYTGLESIKMPGKNEPEESETMVWRWLPVGGIIFAILLIIIITVIILILLRKYKRGMFDQVYEGILGALVRKSPNTGQTNIINQEVTQDGYEPVRPNTCSDNAETCM